MAVSFGGWTFGIDLADLIEEAVTVYAGLPDFSHLGSTSAKYDERMADYVNRAIEEFMEDNPGISNSSTTISVVSGTSEYNVPADMHGLAIRMIEYADSDADSVHDLKQLEHISRAEVNGLDNTYKNGYLTDNHPQMWSFDEDASAIVLYPEPAAAHTLNVHYRVEPTAITTANVTNRVGTPVSITELPKRFQAVPALYIAKEVSRPINFKQSRALEMIYEKEKYNAQRRVAATIAQWKAGQGKRVLSGIRTDATFKQFRAVLSSDYSLS